jgi:hypothetical protein
MYRAFPHESSLASRADKRRRPQQTRPVRIGDRSVHSTRPIVSVAKVQLIELCLQSIN